MYRDRCDKACAVSRCTNVSKSGDLIGVDMVLVDEKVILLN